MRMSWRTMALIVGVALWPLVGCHQLPGDKATQGRLEAARLEGHLHPTGSAKNQDLTAADITQSWLAKAEKLEKDGHASEAIVLCEKMREPGSPHAAQATKKIALIYDRNHDLDRAEQEYQRILQQNPKDAEALSNLGYLSYRRGHWGIAEKHLRNALAIQPDHVYAKVNLGMTLAQQGYYDASVEILKKVVSESEAYCNVAFVLTLQGKSQEAARKYEAALKLEPGMSRATTELAKIRLADASTTVTLTTPYRPGQKGAVELEAASRPANIEGTGRQMMMRPTLPPLQELDLPPAANKK